MAESQKSPALAWLALIATSAARLKYRSPTSGALRIRSSQSFFSRREAGQLSSDPR